MTQGLENALYRMRNRVETDKNFIYNDENESIYTNFLTVDVSNQLDILCPLYCLGHVYRVLTNSNNEEIPINEVVVPLNVVGDNYYNREFKTIDSALKYVFDKTDNSLGVFKSIIKGETFYGCRNLLIDSNFDILFMPCVKMNFTEQEFKDFIIVVDYNLLDSPTAIVSKAIMKKLIPYYISGIIDYSVCGMNIEKTPSVFFTNMRGINSTTSTRLAQASPYYILNTELQNLINSIDYVS